MRPTGAGEGSGCRALGRSSPGARAAPLSATATIVGLTVAAEARRPRGSRRTRETRSGVTGLDLLVVVAVAEFCPWSDDDLAELAQIRAWMYPRSQRARDWNLIAETSARAVDAGLGDEDADGWLAFGEQAGLRRQDLAGFDSLGHDPLDVTPLQWYNGRHRGWLIQQAGAQRVAVLNPEWCHPSWRDHDRSALGPAQ